MKSFAVIAACALLAIGLVSTPWVYAQAPAPAPAATPAPAAAPAPAPAAAPAAAGIVPIMKTERLMKVFADPITEKLKEATKEAPAAPKGWRVIQDQGEAAAEVANLTMMREGEHENTPEWDQYAEKMKTAGLALADAAAKKDFADVQAKYQVLVQSCNECHKKYEPDTAPEILP